jgi:hypothetical protein
MDPEFSGIGDAPKSTEERLLAATRQRKAHEHLGQTKPIC